MNEAVFGRVQWSDGESNPDLLNAIQRVDDLITIHRNALYDKQNRRIADGAAKKLLHRVFRRAMKHIYGEAR